MAPAVAFSLVLLTKVFRQKPSCRHGTPGPGMIDTLSHYLMTALVERVLRSDTGKWLGTCTQTQRQTHTRKHTHTHTHILHKCMHAHTYTVDPSPKDTLRSSNTHQLGNGNISRPWCVYMCAHSCSRGRIHQTQGKVEGRRCFAHRVHRAPETCYFGQQGVWNSPLIILRDEHQFL